MEIVRYLTYHLSVIGIFLFGSCSYTLFLHITGLRQWTDWSLSHSVIFTSIYRFTTLFKFARRTLPRHSGNPATGVSSNPQRVSSPPACQPCVRCSWLFHPNSRTRLVCKRHARQIITILEAMGSRIPLYDRPMNHVTRIKCSWLCPTIALRMRFRWIRSEFSWIYHGMDAGIIPFQHINNYCNYISRSPLEPDEFPHICTKHALILYGKTQCVDQYVALTR